MTPLKEVVDQLKFLLFKSPVPSKTKMAGGMDWEGVALRDLKVKNQSKPKAIAPMDPKGSKPNAQLPIDPKDPKAGDDKQWKKPEKWISAGGVVVAGKDDYSKIYIRLPSNNFGPWAFAKGRVDKGESPPKAALREVEEEIGVKAALVPGGYLGTGDGGYSVTHYYLMYAVRDSGVHDKETEQVKLVDWAEAIHTFARAGNLRDLRITTRALDMVERMRKSGKIP